MDEDLILNLWLCGAVILFFLYSLLVFKLVENFLEEAAVKKWIRFPVAAANAAILAVFALAPGDATLFYLLWGGLLFVEFIVFFKDKISAVLFCTLACVLHIIAIRSICFAIVALTSKQSIYRVANNLFENARADVTCLVLLCCAILLVLKFIPSKTIKIINQHAVQRVFMITWILIFCFSLLCNGIVYGIPQDHPSLIISQIVWPAATLIGLYVVLFFSIKTGDLLGYKEKSEELQLVIDSEQQYREAMTHDSIASYEFNVTKDTVTKGFEPYSGQFGSKKTYSEMLLFISQKYIHHKDIKDSVSKSMPSYFLSQFDKGKSEVIVEYRRLMPSSEYIWVRAVTNLVRDTVSGDIRGFTFVKNIDSEKRHQLELQEKAETDSLTGLYNKGTTGVVIENNLSSNDIKNGALFIIDVDNFKCINDHLGHIYGDAVLCELSEKLKAIFADDGIVGRIGGDEFIAFMKNPKDIKAVTRRGEAVRQAFLTSYKGDAGNQYAVSGSIGIALFPEDGSRFEELYKCSDAALYAVKSMGKNSFKLYDGKAFAGYGSSRTEIDANGQLTQKSFKENRIEYVFKILYASDSPITAIHAVLELVTSHFNFDRGYIFETSLDEKTTSNTFEWCREGVSPEINSLQNIPIEAVATANRSFKKTGMFILRSLEEIKPIERAILEPQGIKSMFQFGIFDNEKLLGFIGFDNCLSKNELSSQEIGEILTICNMLATFFVKQRTTDNLVKNVSSLTNMLNTLDNFTYVIERDSYRMLFLNLKTIELINEDCEAPICYRHFRGLDKPCEDCPIQSLSNENKNAIFACEIRLDKYNMWIKSTASHLNWINGEKSYLISAIDITQYKEKV